MSTSQPNINNIHLQPDITVDQENGARWAVFNSKVHPEGFTILTSAGVELINDHESGQLRGLIHQYRAAEVGSIALLGKDQEMRKELGRGQEAVVYAMGPYAVREVTGIPNFYNALGELQRMNAINDVIDHGLPRWLNLPDHYALHADPKMQRTYTLMDKVDSGITVEDITNYPDIDPARARTVEKELGRDIEDAQDKVPELYERAYDALADAISDSGRNPANYLTDWKPRNAIIEGRLATPIAGSNYKLSVIDQYRA